MTTRAWLQRLLSPRAFAGYGGGLRARLELSNQIALILGAVSALGIATNAIRDAPLATGFVLLLAVVAGVPWLNAAGAVRASRALLVVGSPLVLLAPSFIVGEIHPANLAALPYAVLTMALLPGLVYAPGSEAGARRACNAYLGVVLLVHDLALRARLAVPPPDDGLINVKLAQIVLWALILATFRFVEEHR